MIRALLLGSGMALASASSWANLSLVNYNGFEVRQSGNTWDFSHSTPESTRLRGGTVLSNAGVSSSQRALVATHKIPVGKGIPVDVVAKIPAANFAKALVKAAKIASPVGLAITAVEIADYLNDIGIEQVSNMETGLIGLVPGGGGISPGYGWWVYSTKDAKISMEAACLAANIKTGYTYGQVTGPFADGTAGCYRMRSDGSYEWLSTMRKVAMSSCPSGWYIRDDGTCQSEPIMKQIDEQEILDKIAQASGWPTSAAIAAQKAINLGVPIETESPEVSGPSNIVGEKTTTTESVPLNPGTNVPAAPGTATTDAGTKTTTKTTSTNVTYSGNTATTSTTTNTVTNITNNITNNTATDIKNELKEDDKKEEDNPPSDTPLGDIPDLYEQKYPDGISGVLDAKFAELKATPLFNLPALLMPSLPNAGTCPSWQLDFSLASWAELGVHTVQAPCWVWDFGKVVVIISALLLARRLIFGG